MRLLLISFLSFVLLQQHLSAQTDSVASDTWEYPSLLTDAEAMGNAYKAGDYKKFMSYLHPSLLKAIGGEAKMMTVLKKLEGDMKEQNMTIKSMQYQPPIQTIKTGNNIQAVLPQQTEFSNGRGRVTTSTHYIALSADEGKTWKFIDANNKTIAQIRTILPTVSTKLILPEKRKPTVERN